MVHDKGKYAGVWWQRNQLIKLVWPGSNPRDHINYTTRPTPTKYYWDLIKVSNQIWNTFFETCGFGSPLSNSSTFTFFTLNFYTFTFTFLKVVSGFLCYRNGIYLFSLSLSHIEFFDFFSFSKVVSVSPPLQDWHISVFTFTFNVSTFTFSKVVSGFPPAQERHISVFTFTFHFSDLSTFTFSKWFLVSYRHRNGIYSFSFFHIKFSHFNFFQRGFRFPMAHDFHFHFFTFNFSTFTSSKVVSGFPLAQQWHISVFTATHL